MTSPAEEPLVTTDIGAGLDVDPARVLALVEAVDLYAACYGGPGHVLGFGPSDAARYTVEAHLRGATRDEWEWVARYVEANPGVLDRPGWTTAEVDRMAAGRRTYREDRASELATRAQAAYKASELDTATRLLGEAARVLPERADRWARLHGLVDTARSA